VDVHLQAGQPYPNPKSTTTINARGVAVNRSPGGEAAAAARSLLNQQTPARVGGDCRGGDMLWTICVILAVLWLLGMVSSYTMGGFLHVLLFLAIAIVLINLIQGRRSLI
jgi:Family of unknown function (DUF5670)